MKTAVEDEEQPREEAKIVTGRNGWTDSLDDETIELLLRLGVIELTSTTSGPGFTTLFYSSVARGATE